MFYLVPLTESDCLKKVGETARKMGLSEKRLAFLSNPACLRLGGMKE